jgi:hypothetical protein
MNDDAFVAIERKISGEGRVADRSTAHSVPEQVIRTTILAGTVPPATGAKSELPPACTPATPEPGWTERNLRAVAPMVPPAVPAPPLAALPDKTPLPMPGAGEPLAAYGRGLTDPVALMAAPAKRIAAHPNGGTFAMRGNAAPYVRLAKWGGPARSSAEKLHAAGGRHRVIRYPRRLSPIKGR